MIFKVYRQRAYGLLNLMEEEVEVSYMVVEVVSCLVVEVVGVEEKVLIIQHLMVYIS